jgi:catechol 2,3-dioxygenase-like lactoylglutathione lyase family enzyme
MKFHHVGIPVSKPQQGETYLERYKLFCTDHERNPFGVQWMRYEDDCPLPELVKTVAHVAFEVDDLEAALVGQEVIIEPNSPSPGVLVAFIVCDGAPVELLQYKR